MRHQNRETDSKDAKTSVNPLLTEGPHPEDAVAEEAVNEGPEIEGLKRELAELSQHTAGSGADPASLPLGPTPDGRFRLSDSPTKEEFAAYTKWHPEIAREVSEKFWDLAHSRAKDLAIRAVYDAVDPDPPPQQPLPCEPAPASRHETMLSMGELVAATQEAAAYLLEYGRNRHNDRDARLDALKSVTKIGHNAAALGRVIDHLTRTHKVRTPKAPAE